MLQLHLHALYPRLARNQAVALLVCAHNLAREYPRGLDVALFG
jgi:hypothetical protein